jgi:hypothetical protein
MGRVQPPCLARTHELIHTEQRMPYCGGITAGMTAACPPQGQDRGHPGHPPRRQPGRIWQPPNLIYECSLPGLSYGCDCPLLRVPSLAYPAQAALPSHHPPQTTGHPACMVAPSRETRIKATPHPNSGLLGDWGLLAALYTLSLPQFPAWQHPQESHTWGLGGAAQW